jgi:hypothetical protein
MADNDSTFNPYSMNASLWKQIEEREYKGVWRYGQSAGFLDPNSRVSKDDLYGNTFDPAIYYEMRYAHDIVAAAMEFRRSSVAALEYEFKCRTDKPSTSQIMAKEAVGMILTNMPYNSLESWLAEVYDNVHSFGLALYEIYIPTEGPNKYRLQLLRIPPHQIEFFNLDEETMTHLKSVQVNYASGIKTIPAEKLVWFGYQTFPGNLWGKPDLRSIFSIFTAYKEDLKAYLALRRLQQGILYFQENANGTNKNSWDVAKAYMSQYFRGRPSPLILPVGMDLKHLAVTIPGIDNADKMLTYFDKKIREALGASLGNLGIDGVGSLALGEEVSIKDHERFVAHVEAFLDIVNGNTAIESNLLHRITEYLGFEPETHTPQIESINNIEQDRSGAITLAFAAIEKGIITKEELGKDNIKIIIEELGFSVEHLEDNHTSYMSEGYEEERDRYEPLLSTMSLPEKYSHIDFTTPKGVADEARKGLALRRAHNRGGTDVGVARARDLSNREKMSPDTIGRMVSFFARHEGNKQADGFNPGEDGYPSAGKIAWLLWGGDAGKRWAEKVKGQMDAADEKEN